MPGTKRCILTPCSSANAPQCSSAPKRRQQASSNDSNQENQENVMMPSTSRAGLMRQARVNTKLNKQFCCDLQDLHYNVSNGYCDKCSCRILAEVKFWKHKDESWCEQCYNELEEGKKKEWNPTKNVNRQKEPILECRNINCDVKKHLCCTTYTGTANDWFYCEDCDSRRIGLRFSRATTWEGVNRTHFEQFMEERLNKYWIENGGEAAKDTPISVKCFKEETTVRTEELAPKFQRYRDQFLAKYSDEFKYVSRAVYLFQRIGKVDVLFFAMYCFEFESHFQGKNWAVIDYLDSVPYFVNKKQKGLVIGEAIIEYFKFAKTIGFNNGHLYADPPEQDDDYVFNIHPKEMKFFDSKKLISWYKEIFGRGRVDVIKNIQEFKELEVKKVEDLPLFVGGLWTNVMQEIEDNLRKSGILERHKSYSIKYESALQKKYKKHAETNFYLEFYENVPKKDRVEDPDNDNSHKILGNRTDFLNKCKEKNWEFCSFRRARYASVAIIRMIINGVGGS